MPKKPISTSVDEDVFQRIQRVRKVDSPYGAQSISEQLYLNANTGQACIIGAELRIPWRATFNPHLRVRLHA